MPRLVAFLRAINVGGHIVPMVKLKGLFEGLGFGEVTTFIASGNVIFASRSARIADLERKIERQLSRSLGFEVTTFLRTEAEVATIAAYQPFRPALLEGALAVNVGLLAQPPSPAAKKALLGYRSPVDDFQVHGREVYWLTRGRQSESPFFKVGFERCLKVRATVRGLHTLRKLVAKHSLGVAS